MTVTDRRSHAQANDPRPEPAAEAGHADTGPGWPPRAATAPKAEMKLWLALAILLALCVDEFSWQLWPWELQGHWIGVTQFLPVVVLCIGVAALGRFKPLSFICVAGIVFKFTTALCSGLWLVPAFRWQTGPDHLQCSKVLGLPILLLSAVIAMLALVHWSIRDHTPPK